MPSEERQEREDRFREAELPVLFCSPTMELGVDIAELNAVNMRNVPPTPANYAQRSGRAGRSGQPALVFTYCTTGSPHDQYFFKRPDLMVAGAVTPPRLDLANEDLVRAHVHAVWLAETGLSLGTSLKDVLDLAGDQPSLELLPSVAALDRSRRRAKAKAKQRDAAHPRQHWRASCGRPTGIATTGWTACSTRWRRIRPRLRPLARASTAPRSSSGRCRTRSSATPRAASEDKEQAKRLRAEAEAQIELLTGSEERHAVGLLQLPLLRQRGLPARLQLPAPAALGLHPGRRRARATRTSSCPGRASWPSPSSGRASIIYHEGSRYIINKVILPVDAERAGLADDQRQALPGCGYLHPIDEGVDNPDLCEQCDELLDTPLRALFRMQNVSTRRRDRINSDEEERMRMGYELMTGVRFARDGDQTGTRWRRSSAPMATELLRLTYGHAATLWRINLGWRRRKDKTVLGFVLDTERGYWERNEDDDEDDPEDPMSRVHAARRALRGGPAQLPAGRAGAPLSVEAWPRCSRRSSTPSRCSTSWRTASWPPSRCPTPTTGG